MPQMRTGLTVELLQVALLSAGVSSLDQRFHGRWNRRPQAVFIWAARDLPYACLSRPSCQIG
jgi:hypothetical protein